MTEKIVAPCRSDGEVRSVWATDINGGPPGEYALIDNDSKEAECRCVLRACCVNARNEVIQGTALTIAATKDLG